MYRKYLLVLICIIYVRAAYDEDDNKITFPCDNDEMCAEDFLGGICKNNICMCSNVKNCHRFKKNINKLGEYCNSKEDCLVANSFCNKKKFCQCKRGTVESATENACLQISKGINSSCIEDAQCFMKINNSVCDDNKCTCNFGTHLKNGSCFPNLKIGDDCRSDNDCKKIKYSKCSEQKCSCKDYFKANGSSDCVWNSEQPDATCSENSHCTSIFGIGSICFEDVCRCEELYRYFNETGKCVKDVLLGGTCAKTEDCHQPGNDPSRLECILGECKCKPTYYEESGYCIRNMMLRPRVSDDLIITALLIDFIVYFCLF